MSSIEARKPLDFYLGLSYPVTMYPEEDGEFLAEIQELPGCMTQGRSIQEVLELIEDARRSWVEAAYKDGQDIPLPRTMEDYSGRFLLRLPKGLHRRLSEAANSEGVSLNQYVVSLLSSNNLAKQVHDKLDALRATVHNAGGLPTNTGRMNWPLPVLPTFKVGTGGARTARRTSSERPTSVARGPSGDKGDPAMS